MSKALMAALGDRARTILKALAPKAKEDDDPDAGDAAVPTPPADPDALPPDPRVDGANASPTNEELDAAAASGANAGGEGADRDAVKPPEGEPPEGEEGGEDPIEDEGRKIKKSFDAFGCRDLDAESVRQIHKIHKAFGPTPPATPEEVSAGGEDVEAILATILDAMEKQSDVLDSLRSEVKRLQRSSTDHERSISKALDSLGDPRTAIPVAPRAITKALPAQPTPGAAPESDVATDIFLKMRSGQMTPDQAYEQARAFKATHTH